MGVVDERGHARGDFTNPVVNTFAGENVANWLKEKHFMNKTYTDCFSHALPVALHNTLRIKLSWKAAIP